MTNQIKFNSLLVDTRNEVISGSQTTLPSMKVCIAMKEKDTITLDDVISSAKRTLEDHTFLIKPKSI